MSRWLKRFMRWLLDEPRDRVANGPIHKTGRLPSFAEDE